MEVTNELIDRMITEIPEDRNLEVLDELRQSEEHLVEFMERELSFIVRNLGAPGPFTTVGSSSPFRVFDNALSSIGQKTRGIILNVMLVSIKAFQEAHYNKEYKEPHIPVKRDTLEEILREIVRDFGSVERALGNFALREEALPTFIVDEIASLAENLKFAEVDVEIITGICDSSVGAILACLRSMEKDQKEMWNE